MRRACIDIGSNTTRLLVAEGEGRQLFEVHQERAFTRIGRCVLREGTITPAKIAEVVEVVSAQISTARELGCDEIHGVATAAIRRAVNGSALTTAIRSECGLVVEILSGEDEARLAFAGAAQTLDRAPTGTLGVVDVGGGSSELVVGTAPDQVSWWASLEVGSGDLADRCRLSDPPSAVELDEARASVAGALAGLDAPRPTEAVAVGGSATSLRSLAGGRLDAETFARTLNLLSTVPATELARRFALDRQRVLLLPTGLLILEAISEAFGSPLEIGRGGVREGVLLRAAS